MEGHKYTITKAVGRKQKTNHYVVYDQKYTITQAVGRM